MTSGGGRFDFDDGGTYCGGWEDGKAHGHGVCTGPKGQGEYSGAWQCGFEVSGVYTWPSGNSYTGQWFQGKRHGLGVEGKGRWVYRGEWTQGFKGRYGVRKSTSSGARYEGTWTTGLQDGYGCETYADGGTYQGQWQRGTRHGYGVRQSVPYGLASHYRPKALRASLTSLRSENEDEQVVKNRDRKLDESRGGFVLKARSDETPTQPRRSIFDKQGKYSLRKTLMSGLKLKKQKSTGDINDSPKRQSGSVRSTISNISHVSADSTQSGMTNTSMYTDSNLSFVSQDDITDINVTESYMGEWKNDKRSGFGISERSDGLKYEGEWYNNKKYGYGVTTFKDGAREEGKYKNNILISSGKKNKLFLIRTSKLRERVDNALVSAQRAAQIALQKADIAITRMANARSKSEQADHAASMAGQDSDIARMKAKEYAPEFIQPGTDFLNKKLQEHPEDNEYCHMKILPNNHSAHQRSKPMLGHQSPDGLMESSHIGLTSGLDSTLPGSYNPGMPDGMNYLNDAYPHTQLSATRNTEKTSISTTQPSRSPSLKIRRYSFLAGSRRGRGFSELFNSTILNDHFDQYCSAVKDDSLGRDLLNTASPHQQQQHHHHHHQQLKQQQQQQQQPQQQQRNCGPASDTSPDSGVSETMEEDSKHRPLQRRRTLPCIIKRDEEAETEKLHLKETKAAVSSENLAAKNPETIVIENGIRKRIKTESNRQNHAESGVPIKSYTIESQKNLSKVCNPGSLPDINIIKTHSLMKPMPREEAYKLSSQRREEIRHLQEIDERRKQGDMAVILGDVKDWCQQRQLLVLLVALNVSLATMFFNLLS